MSSLPAMERLRHLGVIAVIRAGDPDTAVRVVDALLQGGVRAVELTFTTLGAETALREVRRTHGDTVFLGAGTIRSPRDVSLAVDAGADFLVTPHLRPDLLQLMLETGLLTVPGIFTPSEAAQALDLGADVVKLFPASTAGPRHLRSLRGPFPDLLAVPTGGIDVPDLAPWLAAGAVAVGAGSELCSPQNMREGRWDQITQRAHAFTEAVRAARPAGGS